MRIYSSSSPDRGTRVSFLTAIFLVYTVSDANAGVLLPGQTLTIDGTTPIEAWTLDPTSTLIADGAETLEIRTVGASVQLNATNTQVLNLDRLSNLTMTGGSAVNGSGSGAAVNLFSSNASITGANLSSNATGILLSRNVQDQVGSQAVLTRTTVTGDVLGAQVNGLGNLALMDGTTVTGTGVNAEGARLLNGTIAMSDSAIIGTQSGLRIGTEPSRSETSSVILNNSRIEGKTGSAIIVDFLNIQNAKADINVLNGSQLIAGNGTLLEVNDGARINLTVDSSTLDGNVIVEPGATTQIRLQNSAQFNGDLQNVENLVIDSRSSFSGHFQALAGSGATVSVDNASRLDGDVNNIARFVLDNGSVMTGNVSGDLGSNVILNNNAVLTGRIDNSTNLNVSNAAQWNMTGSSAAQNLTLSNGVVRMGGQDTFERLDVVNLKGNGTFVMGTDLNTGNSDFLNVTGNATGQHQLLVSASGQDPVSAQDVKIGSVASGDAQFSLANRQVDAGAFTYKLVNEGNGLLLRADQETVSTPTNAALAIAGSAASIAYAGMTNLNTRMGDRRLNNDVQVSNSLFSGSPAQNLSNSVWVRSYGNQYSVANAYGDGYTQNQYGFSLGADTQVDLGSHQWLLGAFVGSSRTNMDLKADSTAVIDSLNAGVYGTLLNTESGVYIDVVGQVSQFDNEAKITMSDGSRSKGNYKTLGATASVEVGKHIRLEGDYFVEPSVQIAVAVGQDETYHLDNGLEVNADGMRSALGELGVAIGKKMVLSDGSELQPRFRVAVNHEFVSSNRVEVNGNDFDNDLSSTSVKYGAGVNWVPAQASWQVFAEVGGSQGSRINQDWSGSMGVSYSF
ncbi:autotransporter outer membrane beta-barrel domain-containing protein [Pseudomonas sp. PB106]|uniref:autotransporter outer membrane beta-barrel domain-containing protein n=1 Tax=Pseudomonas sp. PB106 TaxID=2494699 RepID=UPI00131C00AA|nr:autotransporter outer membrane beta-barrel domain-containing protein [Pseudomonas sp. PB106]KAE9648107.1 autotransporter outer membrane beta-barrel domain-containing protein [Pseudomonas sp. PB106]